MANAGLLLPASLALRLGLGELVDRHVDLGRAPGRANTSDKLLTLVASALAGGDCIDDADVLRAGGTARVLGCVVKAPSTLGIFLRSFRWGHVRQLDRVSRELLAQAWAAGAGPGDGLLTIDLDSTICETYGLAKEGARRHGYTRPAGLSPAAGRGRRHRRGAVGPAAGGPGQHRPGRRPLPAGDGGDGCATPGARDGSRCGPTAASTPRYRRRLPEGEGPFSITVRQHQSLRNLIEAIPEADWRPIPYWMEGAAAVAEINYTPFKGEPDAVPVRLIVRRVRPTPGS